MYLGVNSSNKPGRCFKANGFITKNILLLNKPIVENSYLHEKPCLGIVILVIPFLNKNNLCCSLVLNKLLYCESHEVRIILKRRNGGKILTINLKNRIFSLSYNLKGKPTL